MKEVPEDYFVDIVVQQNQLAQTFHGFFLNFREPQGISAGLVRKASMLKHALTDQFEWEFEDEDEDEMPVIVEM